MYCELLNIPCMYMQTYFFSSRELMPWCVVHSSTFPFKWFFSRMAAAIYSKLDTNVPYQVRTMCCYFLCRSEIQYGHPGLWLANTFSTSQEWLQGSTLLYSKHGCSLWGPDEVLLLFIWIRNPRWPLWPL